MTESLKLTDIQLGELEGLTGLEELDRRFLARLEQVEPSLHERLLSYRGSTRPETAETSELLLDLAPWLESFIAELFGATDALADCADRIRRDGDVLHFKQTFVQKLARKQRDRVDEPFADLDAWVDREIRALGVADDLPLGDRELAVARLGLRLLEDEGQQGERVIRLARWCAAGLADPAGQAETRGWSAFRLPEKVDHAHLVELEAESEPRHGEPAENVVRLHAPKSSWRQRDGFELTDARATEREALSEAHYCIYCHSHEGDFCSRGFPEKKGQPELGYKVDPLGVHLSGCPLDEKISEMNLLYKDGHPLAALAVAMVDNPMIPATGHRICNDCMKSCIYQKQDPVNIPQIETRCLTDVLELPYGPEVYHLLARWNPLRHRQYLPKPDNGRRVLIAGQGPAGFTLAHYLTMEGCTVVAVDGLKIEDLPEAWRDGPVEHWSDVSEPLESRTIYGFGGVAEYGITNRWDKNFLKLIQITLSRRDRYQLHGGVRIGGTLTLEDAWELGFDHVALATGAGYPRVLHIGNSLCRGMRQANDFLMALQLTGAGKQESLANLQVRMPAVVIGGGLTAVDTATEVQAHYIAQVEKIRRRYTTLREEQGEEAVTAWLGEEDQEILAEFLEHGRQVVEEREAAEREGREPDFIPLLHAWGGVTIAYRKGLNASPAYVRNHEEMAKAAEEGIFYAEGLDPIHAVTDRHGHVQSVIFRRMRHDEGRWYATGHEQELPARAVFVAAGTVPNTIYAHEHPGELDLESNHYRPHARHGRHLQPVDREEQAQVGHPKTREVAPFTSYDREGRTVSFLGDTHPVFAGSVVKAIASAQRSYPQIVNAVLQRRGSQSEADDGNAARRDETASFLAGIADRLEARVVEVNQTSPAVVEVWIRAPMAAQRFRPGQFFRLQTLERSSPVVEGTRMQVPLLTVSGTGISRDGECVRLMVLQWGAGPRVAGQLQPGERVILMGPTGAPTDIPTNSNVMVVAGRWGAAVMHDIGTALRAAGNRVLYIAAFGAAADIDHPDELEAGADQIVWATAKEPAVEPRRPQDCSVVSADMVDLVRRYGDGEIGPENGIPLAEVEHMLVVGGTGLLKGFQGALANGLRSYFPEDLEAMGTVGSPMQCMLKGVCAQCLQWQIDPETGERTRAVFSCAQQDQPLSWIDLDNLSARQQQNRLSDLLAAQWVERILRKQEA